MTETGRFIRVEATNFDRFFATAAPSDLFETLKQSVSQHFMLTGAFLALGATTATFRVPLHANATTRVEFKDHGVPSGSIILDVNQTGTGGPMALEWQINSSQQRFSDRGVMHLYGACPNESLPREGDVCVAVTWIAPPNDETPLRHLIDAARHFSEAAALATQELPVAGHFDRVIIPANVAAESALGRVMFDVARLFANRENAETFLSSGATYAHQLKVLLPMVAHLAGAPDLPNEIRGALDRLRAYRNKIAHRGESKREITRDVAAEMLTAALFGYHYARVLGRHVEEAKKDGRLPAGT